MAKILDFDDQERGSPGWDLGDLNDVLITSAEAEQVLYYDADSGMWKNTTATSQAMSTPYTGNDVPGSGNNTLVDGNARIWNRVSDSKSFLVNRVGSEYRLVEMTVYA